jgi:hypothetical protein
LPKFGNIPRKNNHHKKNLWEKNNIPQAWLFILKIILLPILTLDYGGMP